jgi:hypothetical protein
MPIRKLLLTVEIQVEPEDHAVEYGNIFANKPFAQLQIGDGVRVGQLSAVVKDIKDLGEVPVLDTWTPTKL